MQKCNKIAKSLNKAVMKIENEYSNLPNKCTDTITEF